MLDITLFRDNNEFEKILDSEKKRNKSLEFAEKTKEYDDLWRKAKQRKRDARAEKTQNK
jgi:seryl-tRNA synthetase